MTFTINEKICKNIELLVTFAETHEVICSSLQLIQEIDCTYSRNIESCSLF